MSTPSAGAGCRSCGSPDRDSRWYVSHPTIREATCEDAWHDSDDLTEARAEVDRLRTSIVELADRADRERRGKNPPGRAAIASNELRAILTDEAAV